MLATVAKKVQSRLTRKGVKVVLGDIKTQCELMISDIENPTEVELLAVQDYFMSNATQLTVITNDIDIVNSVDNAINTASIQDIDSNDLHINEADLDDQPAPLATTTKNELVANAAVSLGIQLSTAEIDQIADNFDAGSDDFTQTLEQVKSAIIAYVQHKIASNNQRIVDTINEISQVASNGFEENSQTLSDGLKHLNQQLIQQSTDFKSKLTGTLSRFKLPAA
jgi:hypothetical protein